MRLVLYTRNGCELCERLHELMEPWLRDALSTGRATLELRDIDRDENLRMVYGDRIPVLTADAAVVLEGNPEEDEIAHVMRDVLAV
jgi:hypothetical protein